MKTQVIVSYILSLLSFASNMRANPGNLDLTFGNGGRVSVDLGSPNGSSRFGITAFGTARQTDGKILVIGDSYNGKLLFAVARYETNGNPDPTFGNGLGAVFTDFGGPTGPMNGAIPFAVAVQNDTKIVVAGYNQVSGKQFFALARYNPNGELDTAFGNNGLVNQDLGLNINGQLRSIALQSDGKIVVAGNSSTGALHSLALARYNSNGSLDLSFGNSGVVLTAAGNAAFDINAVTLYPGGKIVTAGGYASSSSSKVDFMVARYLSNGSPDSSFGNAGRVTTDFGVGLSSDIAALAVSNDGRIAAAGYSKNASTSTRSIFALARYNADGKADTSFGGGSGKITTDFGKEASAKALALQTNGAILAVGQFENSGRYSFALARYTTDGILDLSYGNGSGVTLTDFSSSSNGAVAVGVALQSDGKAVAAGRVSISGRSVIALARYQGDQDSTQSAGLGPAVSYTMGDATLLLPTSLVGHTYLLQRNDNLVMTWNNSGEPLMGNGGELSFHDNIGSSASKQLYRVVVDP